LRSAGRQVPQSHRDSCGRSAWGSDNIVSLFLGDMRLLNIFYRRVIPWLAGLVLATGGVGMLAVGFIDSATTLPPVLLDILLIEVSMHRPALPFLQAHKVAGTFWCVVFAVAFYLGARIVMRPSKEELAAQEQQQVP
jgi:hypothetical protein